MQDIKVLLLEDNSDDAALTLQTLQDGGFRPHCVWVNCGAEFVSALDYDQTFDLVLADYSLPDFDGEAALAVVRGRSVTTPFIVLSSALGEETAVEMLKNGATDFVLKHRLSRLVPAVHRALREVQEVRGRKEIEEELQRANRRFQQAAELVNAIIYEWDLKSGIVQRSPTIHKLIGYLPEETSNDSNWWRNQVHPDDLHLCFNALNNLSPGSKTIYAEYRVKHAAGHFIYVCDRAFLDWEGDQVVRMLGITEDISQHKATEEVLRKAKDAAEAANQAKSMFLANMSHEIRTPLGAILGFTELCLTPGIDEEEKSRSLMTIKKNSTLLSRIIDDILDLSKVEAGKMEIEFLDVLLPDLICDVLNLLRVQAESKGLALVVRNSGPVPRVIRTDPTRLRQVLLNIVGNAIKFTESGGVTVTLQWEASIDSAVRSWLQIDVTDTGVGMAAEQVNSLFKHFSQTDTSTTRRFGGTGLGLVLAKRLAQALHGDVSLFRTELNRGSTFRIIIDPLCDANPELLENLSLATDKILPTEYYSEQHLAHVRLLLVDDVVDNLVMIRLFLKAVGATVDTTNNGAAAIVKAFEHEFDLILMDIQMPGMDGHQAVKILRQKGFRKPIIALTAHAMREERDRCLTSGFTAYLTKPIAPNTLYDSIRRLVSDRTINHSSTKDQPMATYEKESLDPADFGLRVGPMDKFVAELIKTDPELREIRNEFLRNLQNEFAVIKGAFVSKNYKLLRERTHVLRGSAGNYGFVDLFDWATSIEQELTQESKSGLLDCLMQKLDDFSPRPSKAEIKHAEMR